MTCVSPQSSRKHPRYIILRASQNPCSRTQTCALISAKTKATEKKRDYKMFVCLSRKDSIYQSPVVVAELRSQILKSQTQLAFSPPL